MVWDDSKSAKVVPEVKERLLKPFEVGIPCSLQQTFDNQRDGEPIQEELEVGGSGEFRKQSREEVGKVRKEPGANRREIRGRWCLMGQ